jgi:hypothetical protein
MRRLAICVVLLPCASAWAALGQSSASIEGDRRVVGGTLQTSSADGYSVAQIDNVDGVRVREYVSAEGRVFGISWQGPTIPDLRSLLGEHFDASQAALKSRPRRRRATTSIHTAEIVVEMSGHMRAFHGRAYIPALLPKAFSSANLR